MPGKKSFTDYKESKYVPDLVKIMKTGKGPFTRKMLADQLEKLYPTPYKQDLMNIVSGALQMDKWSKANRFNPVENKKGWYDLNSDKF